MTPEVRHFYHPPTGTLSYVVSDPSSGRAAIVDPVLGFCIVSGRTDTEIAMAMLDYIERHSLDVQWILETHAHADHLSAAQFLKSRCGGTVAIGKGIRSVQAHFADVFNLQPPFVADGRQFDKLFADGEQFSLGNLTCGVMHTPGHTNDSVTYRIGDCAFVGDSLFMPDFGTARCDFPGGDAAVLFDSIQKLFALPPDTRLFMCHDYPPEGRELRYEVSVAEQKNDNKHVGGAATKEDFVAMREARDATLSLPALILPAIQVNIRAGDLPAPDSNNISYLRIPLNLL